jgi:adenylate kinase family enzyme
MEILIITGPPYSGKGTQCEILKTSLDFNHISTGDRVRREKEENTPVKRGLKFRIEKMIRILIFTLSVLKYLSGKQGRQ